jgi:O-antigen biosynthesis protein
MPSRFNPLDYPVSLASPERLAPSTWLTHVPFAMFLVDLLRPSVIVELGTQYGVSYCAFCQAVQASGLSTRCFAIDTWTGDSQTGHYGNEVLSDLKQHHDPYYSGFSHLIQSTFEDALSHFEDGSIDLLHIDGFHTYEAVRQDFIQWLPKLSQKGVILFHDISVRDNDFGVWRLWDELKSQYPFFDFSHGYGLGMLVVGSAYPASLDQLLRASDQISLVQDYFYQLGLKIEKEYNLSNELAEQKRAMERIINSKGWRLITVLRRFRLWLLPVNSWQERFAQSLFKGIKNVYHKT